MDPARGETQDFFILCPERRPQPSNWGILGKDSAPSHAPSILLFKVYLFLFYGYVCFACVCVAITNMSGAQRGPKKAPGPLEWRPRGW